MDIKDSYLHSAIGVVKSIDVKDGELSYTLADVGNTRKTFDLAKAASIPFIVGTLAPPEPNSNWTTGTWTGNAPTIKSLDDGLTIRYWLPYNGSGNATLNLKLADGTYTGDLECYYKGTTRLTTHISAGTPITLTYRENPRINGSVYEKKGWWMDGDYDSDSGLYRSYSVKAFKTGASDIPAYNLIGINKDGLLVSALTTPFLVDGPLYIRTSSLTKNKEYSWATLWERTNSITIKNGSTNLSLTTYKPLYLKGEINNGLFTAIEYTQILPTTEDGKAYLYIGEAVNSTSISFSFVHPIYIYKGGTIQTYSGYSTLSSRATLANTVSCTVGSSNAYRPIVVTNESSGLFYNSKITANYETGDLKATTFTGKLAYTNLTGSTTTANQAIVSNGTANGWTLKTLGSNAFNSTAYLPLSGGTLTGALTIKCTADAKLILDNIDTETNFLYIDFRQNNTSYGTLGITTVGGTNLQWAGKTLLHTGNYSTTLDGRYYTESEIDTKLGNYVTIDTTLTITGSKRFNNTVNINTNTNTTPLKISRLGGDAEYLSIGLDDATTHFHYKNDEFGANFKFTGEWTNIGDNGTGASPGSNFVLFYFSKDVTRILLNDGTKTHTVLHSGIAYIKDGQITINGTSITPLTSHLSLANYVTLDSALTITGLKTFKNIIYGNLYGNSGNKAGAYLILNKSGNYLGIGASSTNVANIAIGESNLDGTWVKELLTITSSGNVSASKFITSGGTSNLFVKGDGSLDSTTYVKVGGAYYKDLNDLTINGTYYVGSGSTNNPANFGQLLVMRNGDTTSQLYVPYSSSQSISWRGWSDAVASANNIMNWVTVLDSLNYSKYLPILNSASTHATNTSVIYAPSTAGTKNLVLLSNGSGAPVWSNLDNLSVGSASNGVFYIEGTATTDGVWLGSHDGITDYYKGLTIAYKIPRVGISAGTTININNKGAKNIYVNSTKLTTHYASGATILLVYDGTDFRATEYWDGNTYSDCWIGTAANTAAKTATSTNYALRAGNTFVCTIRYTNTVASALTLNVNSTGAKPIYLNGTATSSTNYSLKAGKYLVYYDGTNYYFYDNGAKIPNIYGTAENAKNADTVDNWHKQYFKIGYDGSRHYHLKFGLGDTDLTWKTIVKGNDTIVSAPTSYTYHASTIFGTIWYQAGNHSLVQVLEIPFNVVFHYVGGKSIVDKAYLYLPQNAKHLDIIRIVRISTNSFELQVRLSINYTNIWIDFLVKTNGGNITPYDELQTAGTGTVVKTAETSEILNSSKLTATTIGSSTTPIYLNAGIPTACNVDTTVTSGSANLITSGGVYTAMNNVNTSLGNYVKKVGDTMTGDLTLYASSGDSPSLIFLRGSVTDSAVDYRHRVVSGHYKLEANSSNPTEWKEALSIYKNEKITTPCVIQSTVAEGTAPFFVTSTKVNTNLNADLLDGVHKEGLLTALTSTKSNNLSITVGGTTKTVNNLYASVLKVTECSKTDEGVAVVNSGLWNTLKSKDSNYIGTFNVYDVYNDEGPTRYGNVLEIVSTKNNHWQPQLFLGYGKDGLIYYRNKNYNNDTWGNWKCIAYTTDNFPSNQINALTGYSKATSASALATTDSLNTALGKLEYKAHFAYNWVTSVTATDTDNVINKWDEIVDFINNITTNTDLTDEFVTRKTAQTITGAKTFTASTNTFGGGDSATYLTVDRNSTNPAYVCFKKNGTLVGYIGVSNDKVPVFNDGNGPKTILHSGNYSTTLDGRYYTETEVNNLLKKYLPLTGGKLTGTGTTPLEIDTSNTNEVGIRLKMGDVAKSWIGYSPSEGVCLYQHEGPHRLGIKPNGTPRFDSYTLLHSGNYTSYKHAYTNLTGSGTTANQAIVSTGTKDGWTLKTLGSRAFDSTVYLPIAGGTMGGNITMPKKSIIVTSDTNSNYVQAIKFYKGTTGVTEGYDANIGWHNTGDTDGAFTLVPYATTTDPWNSGVGLYISKIRLKYNNNEVLHSGNYSDYTVKKDGTGATGTWGINITGNAATATKLATARTIWGQSFDGTGNVDGKLTITSGGMQVTGTAYFGGGTTYYFGSAGSVNCYALTSNNTATFKNNTILNNSSDPYITFKDTTASLEMGKIYYVTSYDSTNKKYTNGRFLFRLWSYTANTATKLNYYENYTLPNVTTGLTSNAHYTILTTKNYSQYLGYIGTTAVQSSSANQSLTGITNLTISATNSESYIKFSRAKTDSDSYGLNYILAPTNGLLALGVGPNASNYITAIIDSNSVRPYATGTKDLGTKDSCWKNTYTQSIYIPGSASSTALISSDSGDNLYFKIGTRTPLVLDDSDSAVRAGSSYNNTFSLGTSSFRWKNVYSVLGNFSGQITSTVASGTAPLVVSSTTKVNNLNVDLLDGLSSMDFIARIAAGEEAYKDILFHTVQNTSNPAIVVETTSGYPTITTANNIETIDVSSITWTTVSDNTTYLYLFDHNKRDTSVSLSATVSGIRYTIPVGPYSMGRYLHIIRSYVASNATYILVFETVNSSGTVKTLYKKDLIFLDEQAFITFDPNNNKHGSNFNDSYNKLRITILKKDSNTSDVSFLSVGFYSTRGGALGQMYNNGFTHAGLHTIRPTLNNTWNFGTSSYKWKNVYATTFYGTLSGNATSAYTLKQEGTNRLTSCDTLYTDTCLRYYLATPSMTTGKPMGDGYILHAGWDNTGYNTLLYLPHENKSLQYRTSHNATFNDWITVLDNKNYQATYNTTVNSETGYYKIAINSTARWMLGFIVRIYANYKYYDLRISGYNYGSNYWLNPQASLSHCDNALQVIFGYDDVDKLWVAIPASSYTGISILDVVNGFHQTNMLPSLLFTITRVYSLSGTSQVTKNVGFFGINSELKAVYNNGTNLYELLHTGNISSYRGYIGTTAVQASSAAQALSGITNLSMSGNLNIINNGAIHWSNGTVQQKITITDDNNPNTAVFSFLQSTNSGSSWSTLTSIYDNGNIYANKFIGNSYSGSWHRGRDYAAFKTEGYASGYSPTLSIKTTNGSWELGTYDNSTFLDKLVFSYVTDDDYNSNTNQNVQVSLRNVSGTIALTSDITKSAVGLGNVQNTAFYKRIAAVNGTNWEMAGTNNSAAFTIFAPTTAGTAGQVLVSSGSGAPTWGSPSGLTAGSLTPIQLFSGSVSVSSSGWTDIGTGTSTVKFDSRDTGTYAIQITSGTNFVASGIFSVYKNLSNVSDEIPLHVCTSKSTRLYLRTMENKLQIASNDTSATSWSITIKIAKIL